MLDWLTALFVSHDGLWALAFPAVIVVPVFLAYIGQRWAGDAPPQE